MQEMTNLINQRMNHLTESGELEKMIDAQLQKTLARVLEDSLRSYSAFGKAIGEKLDESLAGAIDKVSFPEYNKFVGDACHQIISQHLQTEATAAIQEQIKDALQPVPKNMTANEFLKGIGNFIESDHEGVEFEDSYYLPVDWDHYDVSVRLKIPGIGQVVFYDFDHDKEGHHIGYIEDDSERRITADLGGATHTYGAIGWFYKLYCTGTHITGLDCADDHINLEHC
jgi:hypothetical protein